MTAAADRHLLFGLLALQTGIIDQGQLILAFQAWTLDKSRSLADHLEARGNLTGPKRAALEALAAVHVETNGGDVEKSLAAVPTNRSTRASLAHLGEPGIDATLTRVARAKNGQAAEADDDNDPDRTGGLSVGPATSVGQRFRILRPHARGGLGEVFVALDAELHREVALKQILEKHADDPVSRQRFVAEAEITGGLEHPGVVPVYGLGTYGSGRPYYAMRFIKGDSLKEAIEQFHGEPGRVSAGSRSPKTRGADATPLAFRKWLRRFLDVCNAIDYAHSRGVIHRDLKPANIILGKHGETLVVDWGLAKAVGRADPSVGEQTIAPSSSGSSETLPGSALGTPAYMSPEQAAGDLDRLGPRSDVYSLGATLYCLLTGKPPFEGDDIGEVLRKVQAGEFTAPREVDPSLDRALEAVCKKAMATKQHDRYASCRALAEDVERWMADEPVTAYAEPLALRARRWAKRNRTIVSTAAVALVAGVVGLSAVLVVQTQAKADIARALASERRANSALADANKKVQARYDLAVEAIKTFHTGVSEDFLLKEDQFKELRDRLLKSASDFYGKLGALLGKEADVSSRRALEQSNFELAELTRQVGRIEDALAAHRAVLAAREALEAETGAAPGVKTDLGRSMTAVAFLLYSTGEVDAALRAYRRSESLLTGVADSDPDARAALAACRTRMTRLLVHAGKGAEALATIKLARADREALAAAPGASSDSRRGLADTLNELGIVLWQTDKPAEAEPEFRTALAVQQKLADENPTDTDVRNFLGNIHLHLGNVLRMTAKASGADAEIRTALAIYQKLSDKNPAVTRFRRNSALALSDLATILSLTSRLSEAEVAWRTAMAILQELAEDSPTNTDVQGLLANTHRGLGQLLSLTGKLPEAEAKCRTALAIDQKLAGDDPAKTFFRSRVANSLAALGSVLFSAGKFSEAEAECRTALAINQKLADENPDETAFRDGIASSLVYLGDAVRLLDRPAEAKRGYERAIALLEPAVQQNPADAWHRYVLACALRRRGLILSDLGDPSGGAAEFRRALALCDGPGPRSVLELFEAACCHATLAGLAGLAGSGVPAAEGEEEAARAMESLRHAIAVGYRNASQLRIDLGLNPLRSRNDFGLLMMDLAFPAEPFSQFR
jgi:serine/threonine-protein kinase